MRYFAYGSNLDPLDWREHCQDRGFDPASVREVCPALMPDMCLRFDYRSAKRGAGAANVAPLVGHVVCGALFEVSDEGWVALDVKEGVAGGKYARTLRTAILPDGTLERVHTYEVAPDSRGAFCAPNTHYANIVRAGLAARGWPVEGLERAAADAPPQSLVEGLFVYGTLMRGESRFGFIGQAALRSAQAATIAGTLHQTAGDYPAMRLPAQGAASARVHGEFMRFHDLPAYLPRLDAVEDFGGYDDPAPQYWRTVVRVDLGDGDGGDGRDGGDGSGGGSGGGSGQRLAWGYVAGDPSLALDRIDSGNWRAFMGTT